MGDGCSTEEKTDLKTSALTPVKNVDGTVTIPGTRKNIKIIDQDPQFPFIKAEHNLESVLPFFIKKNVLGRGASSEVCAVKRKGDGHDFAMKIMKREDQWNAILFKQEHDILTKLSHRNIVAYQDCYMDKTNFYISMELCKGGELFDKIKEQKKFSETHAAQIILTVLHAIAHCHSKNIVHRDIKPENIVFRTEAQRELVLIDFGDSTIVQGDELYEDFVGTAFYLAPESVRKRTGNELKKTDVWSIGIMTWVMLFGRPPFYAKNNSELLKKIIHEEPRFPRSSKITNTAKDFLLKMLSKKPAERPSAIEALEHKWLKGRAGSVHLGEELLSSLSVYTRSSKLKRVLVRMLEHRLTKAEKKALKRQFDEIDSNNDGMISAGELSNFIRKRGGTKEAAMQTANAIVSQIDQDGDKMISLAEWQDAKISTWLQDENVIKKQFKKLDLNGDGLISQDELTNFFKGKISSKLIKKMIKEIDTNNDGEIGYDDFAKAMKTGCLKDVICTKKVEITGVVSGPSGALIGELAIPDVDEEKN